MIEKEREKAGKGKVEMVTREGESRGREGENTVRLLLHI